MTSFRSVTMINPNNGLIVNRYNDIEDFNEGNNYIGFRCGRVFITVPKNLFIIECEYKE